MAQTEFYTRRSEMPRYTLCPYYVNDRRRSISCEDVFRRYDSYAEKYKWMDTYCDSDWQECPYAKALDKVYEQIEKGDMRALDRHRESAQHEEMRKLSSALGRAEKGLRTRDEKIKELRRRAKVLEDKSKHYYSELRKLQSEHESLQHKYAGELSGMARIYEDRMAYLMDTYTDGSLAEADVEKWAKGKEFAITYEGKEGKRVWKVVKRDAKVLQAK